MRKILRPYIYELLVFLVILSCVIWYIFASGYVVVHLSTPTLLAAVALIIWGIQYRFCFVLLSLRLIFDILHGSFITLNAEYIEQFEFKFSSLLDKNSKWRKGKTVTVEKSPYYKIAVRTPDGILILTSSQHVDLSPNTVYKFVYGQNSHAIADVSPL